METLRDQRQLEGAELEPLPNLMHQQCPLSGPWPPKQTAGVSSWPPSSSSGNSVVGGCSANMALGSRPKFTLWKVLVPSGFRPPPAMRGGRQGEWGKALN